MIGPGDQTMRNLAVIGQQAGEEGRATKWDPAHCETICTLAQAGKWPVTWAATIGVTFQTFRNWMIHPEWRDAVVSARYLLASFWAEKVSDNILHPNFKMTATLKMLERKLPDLFGVNAGNVWAELGLTGNEEVASPEERARSLTNDQIAEELDRLRRRRAHTAGSEA